ncbi:MAG: glycosyltransferase family 4 protein [Patescibacteria group bacterium]
MKVLAIAETLKIQSGWGRYARSVIDEYKKKGIDYTIITARKKEAVGDEDGILGPQTKVGFIKNLFATRAYAKDCDIVHAYDVWPYAVYGWFAVLGTKKRLFITGVGTYSVAPFNSFLKGLLAGWACRRAEKIFSIADYTKRRMLEKIKLDNIITVFWGTSVLEPLNDADFAEQAAFFDIPIDRHPRVLTVGQIKHRKGQLDTLKALAKIKDHYPDFFYVIVGSDEDPRYIAEIKKFAAENGLERNIKLVHNAKGDKPLRFFYAMADVFAMNSNNDGDHFEGFGLVFLEAEQFGKPVIGSSGCGIEQALEDGYNGYLTRQSDINDIADKFKKLFSGDMKAFGEHSKEFYKRFTWEKTTAAYIEHYNQKT